MKSPPVSFRDDGYAAVDWVARYLDRVGELPVLAQVQPGELSEQLPPSAPESAGIVTLRMYSTYGPWEEPGRLLPNLIMRGLAGALPPLVAPGTAQRTVWTPASVSITRLPETAPALGLASEMTGGGLIALTRLPALSCATHVTTVPESPATREVGETTVVTVAGAPGVTVTMGGILSTRPAYEHVTLVLPTSCAT